MPNLKGRRRAHQKADPSEYYATTPAQAEQNCFTLREDWKRYADTILNPAFILEPMCGAGTWFPGIRKTWPNADILGIERNPALAEFARRSGMTVEERDVFKTELARFERFDVVVGNPAFSKCQDLVSMLQGRIRSNGWIAMMVRLDYLATAARYESFWRIFPATCVYVYVSRVGFTPDGGTDGTEYMLALWRKGFQGDTIVRHLDNRFVQNKWNGKMERRDKAGRVTAPAVLDPTFPDPRTMPWHRIRQSDLFTEVSPNGGTKESMTATATIETKRNGPSDPERGV